MNGDIIRDVMTPEPVTVPSTTTLEQAARHMRDAGIGNVIETSRPSAPTIRSRPRSS